MMLQEIKKFHYLYDLNCDDKMPQFKKKKVHRYAMNIEKIVKINNVVNIKDYDDNE